MKYFFRSEQNYFLGISKAKQVGLEEAKKTKGGVSAGSQTPFPPSLLGMSMFTDSMVFFKASLSITNV